MTIAFGSSSGVVAGTTSLAPSYPSGLAAGDLLILCVANKYPANGPSTPAGWTLAAQGSGGSGANGLDTGSVYSTIFYRVADGSETGTLTVTITGGNSAIGQMLRYTKTEANWHLAATSGANNTPSTSWSVTGAADIGIQANDLVIVSSAINTDAFVFTSSTKIVTTPGVTFATSQSRSELGTTNGDDSKMSVVQMAAVPASGGSSGVPVYTMTGNGSAANAPAGASVIFRLREATPQRFYFRTSAVPPVSPAFDPGWGDTSTAVRRVLTPTKMGDAITSTLAGTGALPNTAGTSAAGANALLEQFVLEPPLNALTISGFAASQLMMRETGATQNIDAARTVLSVVSNDGLTVRGTLLPIGQRGTILEFTSVSTHRNVTVIAPGTAVAAIDTQAGDRLVLGIGAITLGGGTGTPTVRAKFGDAATDLPVDDVQTTDGAGYLELSQTLSFVVFCSGTAAVTSGGSGAAIGSGSVAGTAAVVAAGSGAAVGTGTIAGAAAVSVGATGAILGQLVLSGAAAVNVGAAGTTNGIGTVSGSGAVSTQAIGAALGVVFVAGIAAINVTATGDVVGTATLAGNAAVSVGASAASVGLGTVTGEANVSVSASGLISGNVDVAGTASATVSASGFPSLIAHVTATASVNVGASGDVFGVGAVAGNMSVYVFAAASVIGIGSLSSTAIVEISASGGSLSYTPVRVLRMRSKMARIRVRRASDLEHGTRTIGTLEYGVRLTARVERNA